MNNPLELAGWEHVQVELPDPMLWMSPEKTDAVLTFRIEGMDDMLFCIPVDMINVKRAGGPEKGEG